MRHPAIAILALVAMIAACGEVTRPEAASTTTHPGYTVSGYAHAGPTCPVLQNPPDPACDDRPVPNAVILVFDASDTQVAELPTAADGTFSILLSPGSYTLVPRPVEGLLGTAAAVEVVVGGEPITGLDFAYDTGIR